MKTFRRPNRLVLFYAKGAETSEAALAELNTAMGFFEDVDCCVARMDVAYHRAVCVAYKIEHCPAVLILDQFGEELMREWGVPKLNRLWFAEQLGVIQSYEEWHENRL